MSKNYHLDGVGANLELGKRGPRIKDNSGVIEHKNQADDGFVIVRGDHPVDDNDLVTKRYLETRANVIVTGQIDGGSPPSPGTPGRIYICTTAGGTYNLKSLYRDTGSSWEEIVPIEGMVISITDDLTGGTDEYLGDHLYMWDADGSTWVDLGPSPAESGVVKTKRITIDYTDVGANLIVTVPANAIATKVMVNVTQVWNSPLPTIEVGDATDPDRLMEAKDSDLNKVGLYVADCFYLYGSATAINITLANNAATPSQGQLTVIVQYDLP